MASSSSTDVTMNQHGPINKREYRLRRKRAAPGSTASLSSKLAGDALAGAAASLVVSPFVAIVDKAVVLKANGLSDTILRSSLQSLRGMVSNPVGFVKSPAFLYVWGVYASTFAVANGLHSWSEHSKQASSSSSSTAIGPFGIFLGTSVTNISSSVLKDRAFSQLFVAVDAAGAAVVATPRVPTVTYGLWMARDSISVGSAFLLPPMVAKKLSKNDGNLEEEKKLRDVCQLCVPMAAPIVSAPFHLLGLDLVNRPMPSHSWKQMVLERSVFLVNGYAAVVGARMARIIPGFGVGGVLNSHLRDSWRSAVVDKSMLWQPLEDDLDHAILPTAVGLRG